MNAYNLQKQESMHHTTKEKEERGKYFVIREIFTEFTINCVWTDV